MTGPGDAAALRVLVVDDEAPARLRLRTLLGECRDPVAEVAGEAADADAAWRALAAGGVDVVLLDIRLPGASGLQIARALAARPGAPAVVFVTAHGGHAVEAFDLEAADYLTKPVRLERLERALQRVASRRRGAAPDPVAPGAAAEAALVVSERGRLLRVPLAEIVALKAGQKSVTVRTARAAYVVDEPLAELEQRLGPGFVRIHRNAIVARVAVRALKRIDLPPEAGDGGDAAGWAVQLAPGGEWLAVSRRQLVAVRDALARP